MPFKAGPFMVIKVSLATITIEEDGIPNSVSIGRATRAPSAKFAERQNVYTPNAQVDKLDDKVDEGRGKTTAE